MSLPEDPEFPVNLQYTKNNHVYSHNHKHTHDMGAGTIEHEHPHHHTPGDYGDHVHVHVDGPLISAGTIKGEDIKEADIVISPESMYLTACGLNPTPDAIAQLRDAFLPALTIMCTRGYDPDGTTWKEKGWRGLVHDILNKSGRLRYHSWLNNRHDRDSAIDIMVFAGMYVRLKNEGKAWGTWGEPAMEQKYPEWDPEL